MPIKNLSVAIYSLEQFVLLKKILLALIWGLVFTQISYAQIYDNLKELHGLRGDVKTVVWEDAEIVFENGNYVEKERTHRRTETYDLQGNLVKEEPIPPQEGRPIVCIDGKCNTEEPKQKYKYNKKGVIIEETGVLMDGTVTSKREFDYDPQGKLLESRYYDQNNDDKLYLANKWVYTRQGNQITSTYYNGCCIIKRWQVAVFDNHRNIIELAVFRPDGYKRKASYSYEYDAEGNWIKRKSFDWVTKDGKSFFEPVEAEYREFSYYVAPKFKIVGKN